MATHSRTRAVLSSFSFLVLLAESLDKVSQPAPAVSFGGHLHSENRVLVAIFRNLPQAQELTESSPLRRPAYCRDLDNPGPKTTPIIDQLAFHSPQQPLEAPLKETFRGHPGSRLYGDGHQIEINVASVLKRNQVVCCDLVVILLAARKSLKDALLDRHSVDIAKRPITVHIDQECIDVRLN